MQRTPDRVALVTGAAGGLGSAIAKRLAAEGARLCLVALVDTNAVASEVESLGARCVHMVTDVTDSRQVQVAVDRCIERFGTVDILVNVAGIVSLGASDDVTEGEWNRVLGCNPASVFLCAKAVLPVMRTRKYGRIVTISSVLGKNGGNPRPWIDAGEQARAGNVAYGAAKVGIHAITAHLAKENAHHGITVNAVAPVRSSPG